MDPETYEDLLAELAVLNMATMKALSAIATLSGDPEQYKSRLLEAGLRDLRITNYEGLREGRLEVFLEKASARYTDLITGIKRPT